MDRGGQIGGPTKKQGGSLLACILYRWSSAVCACGATFGRVTRELKLVFHPREHLQTDVELKVLQVDGKYQNKSKIKGYLRRIILSHVGEIWAFLSPPPLVASREGSCPGRRCHSWTTKSDLS